VSSISIISLLISNAVTSRRDKTILYSRVAVIILIYSSFLAYNSFYINFLEKGLSIYGGLLYSSSVTHFFQIFIFLLGLLITGLTAFYNRKVIVKEYSSIYKTLFYTFIYKSAILNKMGEQFRIIEYSLMLLFVIIGTLFLVSASDLVTIFISLELQSYGLYLICAFYRNSESATAGGLMYFLLGGLSSCFILLATALLYINSGTTDLDNLYIINNISNNVLFIKDNFIYWYNSFFISMSLLIMSIGFLFKVSAAPFHFWSPDVYDAIPTIVTTFVAIIAKVSLLILLLELVHYSSKSSFNFTWTTSLILSSLLSLVIGTVLGLSQSRIKRLFAYSTISHIGFILLGLSINTIESIQAFMFYLIQYSLSNLNAFIILLSIGYLFYCYIYEGKEDYNNLQDRNYSPIQYINQIKGYFYINPFLAISLSITLFSFIGVPPLLGFFGKQMILSAALDNGYIFMSLVAILTSVIGAGYYLVIIKQIYFFKPDYKLNLFEGDSNKGQENLTGYIIPNNATSNKELVKVEFNTNNIALSSYLTIIISIITSAITLFMFVPNELINIVTILTLTLFNI
jgi:NADH-ubiquinone oxidoreductase chain 2